MIQNETPTSEIEETSDAKITNGNVIVDIELLSAAISSFMKCKYCNACDEILCYKNSDARLGLASYLVFECKCCKKKLSF